MEKAFSVASLGLRVWVGVLPRAALWPDGRACLGYGLSTASRLFRQCSFLPETKVCGIKAPKARKNTAPGRHSTKIQAL